MHSTFLTLLFICTAGTSVAKEPMIHEIEKAAQTFIQDKLDFPPYAVEVKSQNRAQDLSRPAVAVFAASGSFTKSTMGGSSYLQEVNVSVLVSFEDLRDEEARRLGALPRMEALFRRLMSEKLGLGISPLQPTRWDDVTSPDEDEAGQALFLLQFKTTYSVTKLDDEQYQELTALYLDTVLKPGDNVADAGTKIVFPQPA